MSDNDVDIKIVRELCQSFEEAYADDQILCIEKECACGLVHLEDKLRWSPEELGHLQSIPRWIKRKHRIRTYTYNGVTRVIGCNCIFVNDEIISMIMWLLRNYDPLSKFLVEVGKRSIIK